MSKDNISTEILELSSLIEIIKKDEINIEERVKRIEEIVNKLDKTVWDSPEKTQIEEELFPFLSKNSKIIPNFLREAIEVLETAKENYNENNTLLNKETTKLEDLKGV